MNTMLLVNPLRILCFGDSLTWGFSHGGYTQHPYAITLKTTLESKLPDPVITEQKGQNGDLAVSPPGGFWPRMDIIYEETEIPFDWAVILGGTNDLTWHHEGEEIYEALQKVWEIPLSNGTKVLALTVPECGVQPLCSPELAARRDLLNQYIRSHSEENFYVLDLHAAIPWTSMPEDRREEIWDDGVHFTEEGYDLMGSLVAGRLLEIMQETAADRAPVGGQVGQKPLVAEHEVAAKKDERMRLRSGRTISKENEVQVR
ncbi:GDSL-like Lipase/Acylhydrolase [Phlyctema vagabunda]|uniref:GDSL-like Lipase/Acylhydrolase n=1 Tax=Phlyctema vagabunda TaxID=108571 RepID=A0ABR4P6A0_9HELO